MASFLRYLGATDAIGRGAAQIADTAINLRQLQNQERAGALAAKNMQLDMATKGLALNQAMEKDQQRRIPRPLSMYISHLPPEAQAEIIDFGTKSGLIKDHGGVPFITDMDRDTGMQMMDQSAEFKKKLSKASIQGWNAEFLELSNKKAQGGLNDKEEARLSGLGGLLTKAAALNGEAEKMLSTGAAGSQTTNLLTGEQTTVPTKPDTPESTIGKVDVEGHTPESVEKYSKSGNYGDLVPVEKKSTRTPRQKFIDEESLRKEFNGLQEVKNFGEISNKYLTMQSALKASNNSPESYVAIDQSLITLFNKMTDPTSVVRESEYARTPNDIAMLNKIKGKVEKIMSGGAGLIDVERKELVKMGDRFYKASKRQFDNSADFYKKVAEEHEIDPGNIVRPFAEPEQGAGELPEGSTLIGKTKDGKSVYQTPDGQKLVVE